MSTKDVEIFKLKILQARYLKAQLAIDEKTFEKAQTEFAKAYHEVCKTCPAHERKVLEGAMNDQQKKKKPNTSKAAQKAKEQKRQSKSKEKPQPEIQSQQSDSKSEPEMPPEPTTKKEQPEGIKKIYRAIARKSHPDKMVGLPEEVVARKEDLFKDAKVAIEREDFLGLYDVARELGIELSEPEQGQIEMLKKTIAEINKQIKMMKETTAWQWHKEKDSIKKEGILIHYMQYIYTKFK